MTLVVHWGNGNKSIFNGLSWEIHSETRELTLFNSFGGEHGTIPIKDIRDTVDTFTVYHVYTYATDWSRSE